MTSARDRIGAMQPPANQPAARSRRRPPDEEPAPQSPAQPAAPAQPAPTRDLTLVPDQSEVSDPASKLASLLAGSDEPPAGDAPASGGRDALLDALTAPPPPPDPDLELVTLGVRIPQYMATALRTMAFLRHRRQQELVREALQQYVPPDLLAECRASAQRGRK